MAEIRIKPGHWTILLAVLLVISNAYWIAATIIEGSRNASNERILDTLAADYEITVRLANMDLIDATVEDAIARIGDDLDGIPVNVSQTRNCIYVNAVCVHINDERRVTGIDASGRLNAVIHP